jgi:hypothetical protein
VESHGLPTSFVMDGANRHDIRIVTARDAFDVGLGMRRRAGEEWEETVYNAALPLVDEPVHGMRLKITPSSSFCIPSRCPYTRVHKLIVISLRQDRGRSIVCTMPFHPDMRLQPEMPRVAFSVCFISGSRLCG